MATSQLISFYASLTALTPALGNKWHWIYKSTHTSTNTHTGMHTHSLKLTLHTYSEENEQLLRLNTRHNNLFANCLCSEWCIIFCGHTIENRHSVIVCCHSPVGGLNRVLLLIWRVECYCHTILEYIHVNSSVFL